MSSEKKDQETKVFNFIVRFLCTPDLREPECVSVKEITRLSGLGLTEKDVRNACRRLKRKGWIERGWETENPDKPNQYGEVWSDEPFVPRTGYRISEKGAWTEEFVKITDQINKEFEEWANKACSAGNDETEEGNGE